MDTLTKEQLQKKLKSRNNSRTYLGYPLLGVSVALMMRSSYHEDAVMMIWWFILSCFNALNVAANSAECTSIERRLRLLDRQERALKK